MRQQTATPPFVADATTAPVLLRRRLLQGAAMAAAWPTAWAAKDTLGGEVRLGQSIALTGPLGDLGQALLQGAKSHFDAVNAKGGINGRRIELVSQDDGYDVKRAVANVDALLADSSTFALFNCFGTPMCEAVLPTVVAAGIPFFAPFTGALSLRVKERSVFNIRASYPDEAEQLVKHLSTLGIKRVAVAYQNNSFGKEVFEGVRVAADKYQVSGIESATVENTGADAAAAATKLLAGNPDAILVGLAGKPTLDFVKAVRQQRKGVSLYALSIMGSAATLKALGTMPRALPCHRWCRCPTTPWYRWCVTFSRPGRRLVPRWSRLTWRWRATSTPGCSPRRCAAQAATPRAPASSMPCGGCARSTWVVFL
jgi:branched-chain amino acid transport system substrate-binding protein